MKGTHWRHAYGYVEVLSSIQVYSIHKEMLIGFASYYVQSSREKDNFVTFVSNAVNTEYFETILHLYGLTHQSIYDKYKCNTFDCLYGFHISTNGQDFGHFGLY